MPGLAATDTEGALLPFEPLPHPDSGSIRLLHHPDLLEMQRP